MQCLVLAGGLGRRMRPATDSVPKCLLPVADRPFVDWQLEWLAAEEVERVVYSIGYRGRQVRDHVGDGRRFGLTVEYVDEGDRRLGTAGAMRLAFDAGLLDATYFALYGDSYLPLHLAEVEARHTELGAPVLMTVYRDTEGLERPNAVFADGMVTWYEKGLDDPPPEMRFVDFGLSVWRRQVIESMVPRDGVADLAALFTVLSRSGSLSGFESLERFYEVGSPGGRLDLDALLRSGRRPGAGAHGRSGVRTPPAG